MHYRERERILKQDTRDQINWLESQVEELNKLRLGSKFTVRNDSELTLLDASTATLPDVVDVLCTLIRYLQEK